MTSDGSMVIVSTKSSPSIGKEEKSVEGEGETDGCAEGSPVAANFDTPVGTPFPDNSRSLVGPHPVSAIGRNTDTQPSPPVDDVTQPSPPDDGVTQPSSDNDGITDGRKEVGPTTQEDDSNTAIPPSSQDEREIEMRSIPQDADQPKVKTTVTFQFETGVDSIANDMNLAASLNLKIGGTHGKRKPARLVINVEDSSDSDYNTPAEGTTLLS